VECWKSETKVPLEQAFVGKMFNFRFVIYFCVWWMEVVEADILQMAWIARVFAI